MLYARYDDMLQIFWRASRIISGTRSSNYQDSRRCTYKWWSRILYNITIDYSYLRTIASDFTLRAFVWSVFIKRLWEPIGYTWAKGEKNDGRKVLTGAPPERLLKTMGEVGEVDTAAEVRAMDAKSMAKVKMSQGYTRVMETTYLGLWVRFGGICGLIRVLLQKLRTHWRI